MRGQHLRRVIGLSDLTSLRYLSLPGLSAKPNGVVLLYRLSAEEGYRDNNMLYGQVGSSNPGRKSPIPQSCPMPLTRTVLPLAVSPEELLQYLPIYKVVVCSSCKYAVQPSGVERHLKDIHHFPQTQRRVFMQHVKGMDLSNPEDVLSLKVYEFPVPNLPVQEGLKCGGNGCGHLCVSVKRMKHHWSSVHGREGEAIFDWSPTPLQTFFKGNLLRYFTKPPFGIPPALIPRPTIKFDLEVRALSYQRSMPSDRPVSYLNRLYDPLAPSFNNVRIFATLDESDTCLLHHWITSTSLTIATNAETEKLWQIAATKLAHEHLFLMHGILACSALHQAHLNPEQERQYNIKASAHQEKGMPLFRSEIANPNEGNCDAVLVFSHLLVIYSWASEKQDDHLLLVEGDEAALLPSWFYFVRAGCSLLCSVWDILENGPVKALAEVWDLPIQVSNDFTTHIVDFLLGVIPSKSSSEAWPDDICGIYQDAAVELGHAFSSTHSLGHSFTTWDALRLWPMYISDEYMNLLSNGHPGALILLAHYCVLLQKIEGNWYVTGRATRLLSTIREKMDKRWHCYIIWPLEEVGLS